VRACLQSAIDAQFIPQKCTSSVAVSADRKTVAVQTDARKHNLAVASWPTHTSAGAATGTDLREVTFVVNGLDSYHWYGVALPTLDPDEYYYGQGAFVWSYNAEPQPFDDATIHLEEFELWLQPKPGDRLTLAYHPGTVGAKNGTLSARVNGVPADPVLLYSGLPHGLLPAVVLTKGQGHSAPMKSISIE
jgi:hypothetical protein